MTITMIVLLAAAGFVSGAVNAIAGGGTFLTFGAMTIAGVPPITANATSSIVQLPGYITSTLAYKDEISKVWRGALLLSAVSVLGALGGSLILLSLDNPSFRSLVPWLLAAATAVFAAGPWLTPKATAERTANSPSTVIGQFLTSIYGGFFGAGMGIMMLAVLGITMGGNYHHLNALKNMFATLIAMVAIVVFIGGGVIAWPEALVMIPAGGLGGYSGVWMARRVPQVVLRWCVVGVGIALTIYYFVTG
ncbi:sulfite exporter TauE/SafE family protein [Rhizobium sp. NTR19]|uniref:Probable membrane transporter protein n=1 Tax=Neorhizobium turbinariae TaxID=2937795 RepID=A0ABT0IU27_9HYPH|nr:sulfite exporter TauE/SafE family protein [Neorhizobium turbinariae]MCK8781353.1 sulfite exporter TauE/SafE family protein [Neorhizobium turbinariae]